jgi:2-keto-4-pentenoate hydratase/2-oxohepta-3-ene-1,7-dioic acid hydratase in catechol pathway
LHLWLEIDRHRYQNSSTAVMVFGVGYLVSYVSRFMSLYPGDIISTGIPPGIGMDQRPPVYLQSGMSFDSGLTVWASSAIPYLLTT